MKKKIKPMHDKTSNPLPSPSGAPFSLQTAKFVKTVSWVNNLIEQVVISLVFEAIP